MRLAKKSFQVLVFGVIFLALSSQGQQPAQAPAAQAPPPPIQMPATTPNDTLKSV